ncbi:MAG: DNA-3-methyladenine glycosylase I, partial [Selenomonas sp.]|nr:DNA-3-methyladenine glycosylase I [Selenomonas sp.]
RQAFDGFVPDRVATFTSDDVDRLVNTPGIIHNRRKIEASITNSRVFLDIVREYGSFDAYIWGFTEGKSIRESWELRTTSPLSDRITKDLKRRGMKFVGSTSIYSTLQAIGVLDAHAEDCDWRQL